MIKLTIIGGAESHLLANELAEADVGVIVTPPRSFPYDWDNRRMWVKPHAVSPCPQLNNSVSLVSLDLPSLLKVL